jgi:hypothetical protein
MKFVRRSESEFKTVMTKIIIVDLLLMFLLLFSYKQIRVLVPPPEISGEKLVGFAQLYGYPLYYDTYYFALIIFLPILIFILFSFKRK